MVNKQIVKKVKDWLKANIKVGCENVLCTDLITDNNIEIAYPNWLIKKWQKQFGKIRTKKLCLSFLNKSSMFIRVDENQLKINDVIDFLNQGGIEIKTNNFLTNFLEVVKGQDNIIDNELFKTGIISIQDPASGAVIELVNPQKGDIKKA